LAALPAVRELFATELERVNAGLAQYSKIKNFALIPNEWTAANGELTPTQKLKRREIVKKYAREIESIYGEPG
jgi:long-chain acyl-CoA synthetase